MANLDVHTCWPLIAKSCRDWTSPHTTNQYPLVACRDQLILFVIWKRHRMSFIISFNSLTSGAWWIGFLCRSCKSSSLSLMTTGPFATAFYLEVSLPDHEYLSATHFPELSNDMNSDCQSGGRACGLLLSMYTCHHSKTRLINARLIVGNHSPHLPSVHVTQHRSLHVTRSPRPPLPHQEAR